MLFFKFQAGGKFIVLSFSLRKIPKNSDCQKTLAAKMLVILLNLGNLVISVAPDNLKLICLFIYYFLLKNYRKK